ncbi:MAG: VanZ family protein [Burkholderiaceae bacterium]|nr:VanZ family protein [Burkholderiaceae bacterium]MDH3460103.1 VanZ family protein [Burkholderiaceae bacterium]
MALPLTAVYAALVAYASLYPLTGWHHPQGVFSLAFFSLPWPRWWTGFDVVANLLGYAPLGALMFAAVVRSGRSAAKAMVWALVLPAMLSLTLELLQNYLPQRVPSAMDWLANVGGGALGALLAALAHWEGATLRWQAARDRWFVARSATALTLLLLWPVGLLFPTPVALGVGQVLPKLQSALVALGGWAQSVPWAADWAQTLAHVQTATTQRSPLSEGSIITLGLLAPCMLAYTVTRRGWRRAVLAFAVAVLGFAVTTLSTALNFGPQHALGWLTPAVLPAFAVATGLATLLAGVSHRTAAALGLVVATALVALVAQAPTDPYFAESLQAWEQGRFIHFHGLAQWVGWLWPYVLLAYLLEQISAQRDE